MTTTNPFSAKGKGNSSSSVGGVELKPTMWRMKIEPKTYFANERTFVQWISTAIVFAGVMMSLGFASLFSSVIPTAIIIIGFFLVCFRIIKQYILRITGLKRRLLEAGYFDKTSAATAVGVLVVVNLIIGYTAMSSAPMVEPVDFFAASLATTTTTTTACNNNCSSVNAASVSAADVWRFNLQVPESVMGEQFDDNTEYVFDKTWKVFQQAEETDLTIYQQAYIMDTKTSIFSIVPRTNVLQGESVSVRYRRWTGHNAADLSLIFKNSSRIEDVFEWIVQATSHPLPQPQMPTRGQDESKDSSSSSLVQKEKGEIVVTVSEGGEGIQSDLQHIPLIPSRVERKFISAKKSKQSQNNNDNNNNNGDSPSELLRKMVASGIEIALMEETSCAGRIPFVIARVYSAPTDLSFRTSLDVVEAVAKFFPGVVEKLQIKTVTEQSSSLVRSLTWNAALDACDATLMVEAEVVANSTSSTPSSSSSPFIEQYIPENFATSSSTAAPSSSKSTPSPTSSFVDSSSTYIVRNTSRLVIDIVRTCSDSSRFGNAAAVGAAVADIIVSRPGWCDLCTGEPAGTEGSPPLEGLAGIALGCVFLIGSIVFSARWKNEGIQAGENWKSD